MRAIIEARGLSKQYTIGVSRPSYGSLRESIAEWTRMPLRRRQSSLDTKGAAVWALKGVSFDVMPGEVVGVIGRNGAGKSTLLKILTRITEPTSGTAELYGRVASLLEIGTGFHPELTGRENVYLNGAILGMRKAEIERSFDAIVAFAEVERFIDTPVKYFSSGMYLRLAFAVAVHLKPEILLVDEVLAVGDAAFQKKCFRKITEVSSVGRTILFVSHNMSAIRSICRRALILRGGELAAFGDVDAVVDQYLRQESESQAAGTALETRSFVVERIETGSQGVVKTFHPLELAVTFRPTRDVADLNVYFGILNAEYTRLAGLDLRDFVEVGRLAAGQRITVGFVIESWPFLHGSYQLELHLKDMASGLVEVVPATHQFDVVETPVYGGRKLDHWFGCVGLRARAIVRKPVD